MSRAHRALIRRSRAKPRAFRKGARRCIVGGWHWIARVDQRGNVIWGKGRTWKEASYRLKGMMRAAEAFSRPGGMDVWTRWTTPEPLDTYPDQDALVEFAQKNGLSFSDPNDLPVE